MPRDAESLKITLWATTGDRTDPENLGTPIDRAVGYTAAAYGGRLVREEVNQDRRERSGAALDSIKFGIPPYSADVDYPADEGVVQRLVSGVVGIYTNNAAAGPGSTVVDPATAGQTRWDRVSGAVTMPGQVGGVTATAGNTVADLEWNAPILGGAAITRFDIRWKPTSRAAWQAADIRAGDGTTCYTATGLANSTEYEFQVRARTSEGSGPWSTTGVTATPGPGSPGRVALAAAIAGFTEVRLLWGQPDLNGGSLVRYEVQWAGPGQSFNSTRQQNASGTTSTVTGLTNGSAYRFRVRVRTHVAGAWSSPNATATPIVSFRRFTTSDPAFAWPYPLATKARVVLKAGNGGDGGGGGGGGGGHNSTGTSAHPSGGAGGDAFAIDGLDGRGNPGSGGYSSGGGGGQGGRGSAGTNSSVAVGGVTHSANGGVVGIGGIGGAGGSTEDTAGNRTLAGGFGGGSGYPRVDKIVSDDFAPDDVLGVSPVDGGGGLGGSGGAKNGGGITDDGEDGGNGFEGGVGETVAQLLTGLSLNDSLDITVGSGGGGGAGGGGGGSEATDGSGGSSGPGGDAGWVEIHPLY